MKYKHKEKEFYQKLGQFLKRSRQEFNLKNNLPVNSLDFQCNVLQVNPVTVRDYERGDTKIPIFKLLQLYILYTNVKYDKEKPHGFREKTYKNIDMVMSEINYYNVGSLLPLFNKISKINLKDREV